MSILRPKILLAAIILVGGAIAANAQPAAGSSVKGYIPLSFVANGKNFDAGHYTISRAQQYGDMSPYVLVLRGDNGESAILQTNGTREHMDAKSTVLTFDNVGGQYYLTGISFKGQTRGVEVRNGTRVQRSIAINRSSHKTVVTFSDVGM